MTESTTGQSLGEAIASRRKEFGASVEQAARWAGLRPERWKEMERGDSAKAFEVGRVADALATTLGRLLRGEASSPRRSVARFRSTSDLDDRELTSDDLRTLALASELSRVGGSLARATEADQKVAELRASRPVNAREEPWKQGYRLGEQARRAAIPRSGPIVSLEAVLTDLGVHVAMIELTDSSLEAASLFEPEAVPVILLNRRSPRISSALSRRAAMGHELCHLLHDVGENDLTTQLSWRSGDGHGQAVEQRARAFAPAFLAPRDEVQQYFRAGAGRRLRKSESKVRRLAERWGLSISGAIWHAKNCDLISLRVADELRDESEDEPSVQPWSECFETERTGLFEAARRLEIEVAPLADGWIGLCTLEALDRGLISRGRAREILSAGDTGYPAAA